MTSEPNDELGRERAERSRARRSLGRGPVDDAGTSTEQEAAIMRARESWTLSRTDPGQPDEVRND